MTIAYIGLGSNLQQPVNQLLNALAALRLLHATAFLDCSPFYRSEAVGPGQQPDYVNAAAKIDTAIKPEALLEQLQAIELAQGRQRGIRWGPRTLDLDLLLYGERALQTASLQLPHPRLAQRNFVLYPLFDIAPQLNLPNGAPLRSLLAKVDMNGLQRLDATTYQQAEPAGQP